MTRFVIVALAVLLGGCGGGGGGGGGSDTSIDGSAGGTGSGSGTGSAGGGGTSAGGSSTGAGKAAILFPMHHSAATGSKLVVRGTASDPDGVARVIVNGVSATIETAVATSKAAETADAKTAGDSALYASAGQSAATTLAGDEESEVDWSAEVELQGGENGISVSVEDSVADATEDADSAIVDYVEVPVVFTLDAARSRVVGLTQTLTWPGLVQRLVEYDYVAQAQTVHAAPADLRYGSPSTTCLSTGTQEFLYLLLELDGAWALHRLSIEDDRELSALPLSADVLDPGEGFNAAPYFKRLVCTPEGDKAYLLADYTDAEGAGTGDSGFAKSRVLAVTLSSAAVEVLTETDPAATPPWIAEDLGLWDGALVSLHGVNASAPLTRIDLSDGSRSVLTQGLNVGGAALAPAPAQQSIYVVGVDDRVDEIDVALPARRIVSAADPASPLAFAQVRAASFDAAEGRVIVGDSELDALVAVNVASGERSEFLSRHVGTGFPLIAPRRLALSSAGDTAYVADDGGNAAERLFEIDLATGDRRVVGDVDLPYNVPVTGIALDEANGLVYVSSFDTVLAVDVESDLVQTVTNGGLLSAIADLALDSANGRLLLTDFASDAVVAVDLETHAQTIFSKSEVRGGGSAFSGPTSLSLDPSSSGLYVVNSNAGNVVRVDLELGDRVVAIDACLAGGQNLLPHDGQFGQVLFNPNANELLVLGDVPLRFDLAASQCERLWPARPGLTFLALAVTPSDQLLAATFGQLLQLDRRSAFGQLVVVSK